MKAISYALKLLKHRARSFREIEKRLKEKGFSENEIRDTIEKLKNYGYIDELEDATNYVKAKSKRGWSRRRIYIELIKRGYSSEIVENALKNYDEDEVILKLKREILRKNLTEEKTIKLLKNRGFEWDIIKKLIRE